MKKYLQITFFSVLFGLIIALKNMGTEEEPPLSAIPNPTPASNQITDIPVLAYSDGTHTGTVEDAYYGDLQTQVVIKDGRIVDVLLTKYPDDNSTSRAVNTQALKHWKQETLSKQTADVDIVSGASESSVAFQKSLKSALLDAARK